MYSQLVTGVLSLYNSSPFANSQRIILLFASAVPADQLKSLGQVHSSRCTRLKITYASEIKHVNLPILETEPRRLQDGWRD